jgi:hypothetical protein
MKFVEVRNDTGGRIVIPAIRGLSFLPGEVKKVSPATVKHPAVSSRIGRGLTLVTSSQGEELKAPIPTVTESPKPVVPIKIEPQPVMEPPVMEAPKETAGNLREAYLAAPGVTEENIQVVMEAFPTLNSLARANVTAVQETLGLSKNVARRLRDWASATV